MPSQIYRTFSYLNKFYFYLGWKMNLLIFLALLGGVAESVGILMFLPLLNPNTDTEFTEIFKNIFDFFLLPTSGPYLLLVIFIIFVFKGIIIFLVQSTKAILVSQLFYMLQ